MAKKRNESVFYNSTQHLKGIHTQSRLSPPHFTKCNYSIISFSQFREWKPLNLAWSCRLGSFEHSRRMISKFCDECAHRTRCARCVEIWNVCVCIRRPLTFGHPLVKHVVNGALKQFSNDWYRDVSTTYYTVCVMSLIWLLFSSTQPMEVICFFGECQLSLLFTFVKPFVQIN